MGVLRSKRVAVLPGRSVKMVRGLLVTVTVVAAALIGGLSGASAASSVRAINVSGTWTTTDFGVPSCTQTGDRIDCATTGFKSVYAGSLKGASTVDFSSVAFCRPSFTYGSGIETFTGSIDGIGSGTLTWRISFVSRFDCATFSVSGFRALAVIQSGTGDFAGARGVVMFDDLRYHGVLLF
jgi:hypothetical protein